MSRFSSDAKQRKSRKYREIHADLHASQASAASDENDGLSKRDRHLKDSADFKAGRT